MASTNLAYEIKQPPLLSMRDILKRLLCPAVILTFAQSVAEGRIGRAWNLL